MRNLRTQTNGSKERYKAEKRPMEEIRNEADALRACYEEFIEAAQSECGLAIHHVEATSRRNSCISVETGNGGSSRVPVLDICFRDESFQKVTDDRRQMTEEAGGTLRKLWQKVTVPYGMYFARKDYCDSRMYLHASDFEQKCFYDFIRPVEKTPDLIAEVNSA